MAGRSSLWTALRRCFLVRSDVLVRFHVIKNQLRLILELVPGGRLIDKPLQVVCGVLVLGLVLLRIQRHSSTEVCVRVVGRCGQNSLILGQRLIWSTGVEQHLRQIELRLTRSEERRVGKECRSRWWP